ncbi:aminoglycoside phosphotransferase family protein [Halosolutus halophilus]|uniref:aminoglycoside phosphotransferase family protein n=1 Tax=Halosolutus halophilus TaxID=1552990 RepID=UPI00223514D1|nr:aminoglycoside phosphotransferase family protein [Halosolutus halophilus]
MTRDVHRALESIADDYAVVRELHAVPPHAVYEVTLDGRRAVCKLARGPDADPATEARVIQYVDRATSIPVPSVIDDGPRHFVAEWHDGAPGGAAGEPADPTLDPATARAMGEGLATLHAETAFASHGVFGSDADGLDLEASGSWADTLCTLLAECRAFLDPYGYADVATEVQRFLRDRPDALAGAGDPVLVHGNYLPEHVGVSEGEIACVIDFEHALVGAAEYDYWATAMPTFENPDRTVPEGSRRAFREGYESVRSLPDGFSRRGDVYRAVLAVTYLRSLYCQQQWATRATADRRAESLASAARSELESLRNRLE